MDAASRQTKGRRIGSLERVAAALCALLLAGVVAPRANAQVFSINDVTKAEGNFGNTIFSFTVSLSSAAGAPVSVDFQTADGSATLADGDYLDASGTANFAIGETAKIVSVEVFGDTTPENDETFVVDLSNPIGAGVSIGDGQGVGTIANDDEGLLSIGDVTMAEGNFGTTTFSFTVSLSSAAGEPVSVDFQTADGSATLADGDYLEASGTAYFAIGETAKIVFVEVFGDATPENDETFVVDLSNPVGPSIFISDGQGVGTIANDDVGLLSIGDVTMAEGNFGNTIFSFTVSLSSAAGEPVSVDFQTADGSATLADDDYLDASGTANFAIGETAKTVSVSVVGDTTFENDETFVVNLSNPVGPSIVISDDQGVGTIVNDDIQAVPTLPPGALIVLVLLLGVSGAAIARRSSIT